MQSYGDRHRRGGYGWFNKRTPRLQRGLGGNIRAMVKVDVRSMAFANDPHITQRVYLVVMQMKIDSDSTFNDGSCGCTAGYATG